MTDYEVARNNMVESQIRTNDVTDRRLLDVMRRIAREKFLPAHKRAVAYIDEDILLGTHGDPPRRRYLMEPMPFARLVQAAEVKASDLVLDVGCATGYNSAVLAGLADSVVALEVDQDLAAQATKTLVDQGIDNVAVVTGPLEAGYPPEGPYDVIFLGGSVAEPPQALFEQLAEGGRLVAVVGDGPMGTAMVFHKINGVIGSSAICDAAVPVLPGFERQPEFVF